MAELRRDPLVGRWVVIDTDNLKGPADFPKDDNSIKRAAICPFCPGREHLTPEEVSAFRPLTSKANAPDWTVRAFPNKFPALSPDGFLAKEGIGIFDQISGVGAHEIIVETPDHHKKLADLSVDELAQVIAQYQERYRQLSMDKRFRYVLIFKNFGTSAGASVEHEHSQIIALPMVPKSVLEELHGARQYFEHQDRCIFCDMVAQEYSDGERLVVDNQGFVSFCPYAPRYAFETWVMPRAHYSDFATLDAAGMHAMAEVLSGVLRRMKKVLSNPSYNFYLHTAPVNYSHPQSYHWHFEIIPKLTRSIGFEWGTGLHIVPTFPKDAARYLREA